MFSYAGRLTHRLAPAAGATATALSLLSVEKTGSHVSSRAVCKLATMRPTWHSSHRLLSSSTTSTTTTNTTTAAAAKTVEQKVAEKSTEKVVVSGGFGGGLLQWYEGHLQSRPVATKMFTGAALWGLGDAVAQVVPTMAQEKCLPPTYDWPRTGRAVSFGFVIHAPISHVHYNFLEWLTVRCGITGLKIPVFKAFMEQFVYWSWISNSLYHGAMGAMQGMTLNQCYDRIADVLWETQKAQWVFWVPVQLINFQYVPVRHQLNVVLLTSIVWTALLSAWYPPETDEEKKEEQQA